MAYVRSENGQIVLRDNANQIIWSTALSPVNILPDVYQINLTNYSITWPDFAKNNAYTFDKSGSGGGATRCASFITITAPQNYVSNPILLGTIPAGANHIFVEVNLVRTKAPSAWVGITIPLSIASGQWILLDGGSAEIEKPGPYRRIFEIYRSGNSVYLRVKQSVFDGGDAAPWNPGNAVNNGTGGYRAGWTHGGVAKGHIVSQRDEKLSGNIEKWRGGGNMCSIADNTNYSTILKGAIRITPAYIPA